RKLPAGAVMACPAGMRVSAECSSMSTICFSVRSTVTTWFSKRNTSWRTPSVSGPLGSMVRVTQSPSARMEPPLRIPITAGVAERPHERGGGRVILRVLVGVRRELPQRVVVVPGIGLVQVDVLAQVAEHCVGVRHEWLARIVVGQATNAWGQRDSQQGHEQ